MKRVLIITYYWPPNGGAGVQRWLKFAKYLPASGWKPVIYTPSNPELIIADPGLERDVPKEAEVIRRPIREPYAIYKWVTGRKGEKVHAGFLNEKKARGGLLDKLAIWVRGNLFIPDARVAWVRPSIRFLTKYLGDHPVDAIVSTGPPHSMHLIARALHRATGIRWIADFRDPWTNIDFYHQLRLSRRADARHRGMEEAVLREADVVVGVGWTMAAELAEPAGRPVEVITNGYDPDDIPEPPVPVDDLFSLVHVGSMNAARDVPMLWRALAGLCRSDASFAERLRLRFVGAVDRSALRSIAAAGLADKVERIGVVDHARAMQEMQRARVLLLALNDAPNARGILTSKLFEYLAVGRPIIAVGPKDGDAFRVLLGRDAVFLDRTDTPEPERLRELFAHAAPVAGESSTYARDVLTRELACLL
ncbi:MAG: glycosyltransferase [Flavobacteriales bacterium]|nr:glycosyltransferase [Flavobacteriales bacterium]MCB9166087.1 glycosyltransferase [Flavobacteriales bacterium]